MDDLVDKLVARFRREMGLLDEEETGVDEFIKYGMAPQANRKRPASVVRTADRLSPPVVADEYWVPPGQPAIVSGYKLKDGMVYIGHGLRRVRGAGAYEPSLIDPNLQVGNPEKAKSSTYGYYSYYSAKSYKDLSPAHRAAYLRWLAGGRKDPLSDMTYPFLFFYGLERRLLENWAHVRDEARALRAEAARLSQVYDDYYLNQHVSAFVELCDLLQSSGALYESPPPEVRKGWGMPLTLSIGLGQLVAERRPVPADWAEAWWRADPGTQVRAAADKRPEEFKQLWAVRYTKQFGTGLKPRRPKRSLQLIYRAASSTFGGPIAVKVGDLPDVTVLTSPMEKLRALGKECTEELGKYNLWVGKHPEAKDSLAAISLLPSDMFDDEFSKPLMKLRDWLDEKLAKHGPAAILDGGELIAHWRAGTDRLPRRESESLLDLLSWLGYGVVPDLTLGEPLLSTGPVALFQLEEPDAVSSSADYAALSVLMHVAAVVACASGDVSPEQRRYVRRLVDALPPVGTAVHPRLWAYFEWRVSTTGSKLTGLNTRIARLNDEYRSAIAPLAVGVAAADGFVSPEEVAALTKLYKMLDLPREDVFSHIHLASVAGADAPVTVRPATPNREGHPLPPPSTRTEVTLDSQRVQSGMADAQAVGELLSTIFTKQEEPQQSPAPAHNADPDVVLVAGLDAAHSSLLHSLAERPTWTCDEVAALAAERGLLPDGALDTINEAALEVYGEILVNDVSLEGDDEIQMNTEALKELPA